MQGELERIFLRYTAAKLTQFTTRISDCLDRLSPDQIWARGSDNENAVGNLVLHLCGNVRQWIGAGVAGKPDIRVRDREFRTRGDIPAADLSERIQGTVADAVTILDSVSASRLAETINVQGYELTVMEAIIHVVEHFAQHTGQIIYATKQMRGEDLGYYRHLSRGAGHGETTP